MKKQTIYEERRMRSKGAYHHFFKESGSTSWKYHNWQDQKERLKHQIHKKEYYLYGKHMILEQWEEARKNREGLPWYKNASMKGTTRF